MAGVATAANGAHRSGTGRVLTTVLAVLAVVVAVLVPVPARALPAAPTGLNPGNNAVLTSVPVLSWTAVPDAASYYVEVAVDSGFASANLRYKATVRANQAPLVYDLAPGTTYYWRVQALDSAEDPGPFSAVTTFTRQEPGAPVPTGPNDVTPADGTATIDYPERAAILSWNPMSGVKSYEVQWSTNLNFVSGAGETVQTATTTSASYAIDSLISQDRDYYWHVRAKYPVARTYAGTEDRFTEYSAPRRFRLEWGSNSIPGIVGPASNPDPAHAIKDPVFVWRPVVGAAKYRLLVSPAPEFDSLTLDKSLRRTVYVPPQSLASGAYYWKVAALDANGSQGPFSATRVFYRDWLDANGQSARPTIHVADVEPGTPGVQMYRDDISFSWDPIPGASHYKVEFASEDNQSFLNKTSGKYKLCQTAQTSVTPVFTGNYAGSEHLSGVNTTGCDVLRARTGLDIWPASSVWVRVAAVDTRTSGTDLTSLWSDQARRGGNAPGALQVNLVDPPADGTSDALPAMPQTPADASLHTGSPQMSWHRVANATKYLVALSKSQNFDTPVLDPNPGYIVTAGTRLTIPEPLANSRAGESYYWYVLPCLVWNPPYVQCDVPDNRAINQAPYFRAFRKVTPPITGASQQLLSTTALSGSGAGGLKLSWTDTVAGEIAADAADPAASHLYENSGTRYYAVEISTDSDFSDTTKRVLSPTTDGRTDATSLVPEIKWNPAETYYWHVRAVDGGGQDMPWSATQTIHYQDLVAPSGLTSVGAGPMKTLRWNAVPGAASYTVEVYSGRDLSFPAASIVATETTEFPAWTPPRQLPAGTYSWRVRRTDDLGMGGTWSSGIPTFTVGAPAPVLATPAASTSLPMRQVAFSWTAVGGAASYLVQVSQTQDFASIYDSVTTTNTRWVPTESDGYPAGTYYWRVKALSAASSNSVLSTSAVRGLSVRTPPDKVSGVRAALLGRGSVSLTWTQRPANDGGSPLTSYRIWYRATGGSWVEVTPRSSASAAARTVTGLLDNTTYEFRVAAVNAAGTGEPSTPTAVRTAAVPDAPRSFSVTGIDRGFTARWSAPGSDLPITAYVLSYRSTGTSTWTSVSTAQTSITRTGLVPNSRYEVKVAAVNAVGRGPDATFSSPVLTKAAPSVPRSVRVTPVPAGGRLTWLAPAAPGTSPVTSYVVSYRKVGDTTWRTKTTSLLTTTITALTRGQPYQVTVAARNSAGTGPASPILTFTPL